MEETMSNSNKIKLLLVDDEIDFLDAIAARLTLKDFDVITASNGSDAVAAANN
jgi:ActR/RegA family two-component response regulator